MYGHGMNTNAIWNECWFDIEGCMDKKGRWMQYEINVNGVVWIWNEYECNMKLEWIWMHYEINIDLTLMCVWVKSIRMQYEMNNDLALMGVWIQSIWIQN